LTNKKIFINLQYVPIWRHSKNKEEKHRGQICLLCEEYVCDNSMVKKRMALVDINGDRKKFEVFDIKFVQ
jgi:hypothetical protein